MSLSIVRCLEGNASARTTRLSIAIYRWCEAIAFAVMAATLLLACGNPSSDRGASPGAGTESGGGGYAGQSIATGGSGGDGTSIGGAGGAGTAVANARF